MHKEHHGILYGVLASFFYAISGVLIKLLSSVPTSTVVFFRFFIALLFVLPLIYRGKVKIRFSKVNTHFLRAIAGLISIYCFFYSSTYLPLVNAITLGNTSPLFVPIVVLIWLKLIIPKMRIFAIVVGFLGVLFILNPSGEFGQKATFIGLMNGLFSAIALVGVRQLSKIETTETILSYYFIISVVASFFPMILTWEPICNPMDWVYITLIGLATLIYQYLITQSYTHAPASKASTISYVSVLFSGIFGWLVFSEIPALGAVFGACLIAGGGILTILSKQESRKIGQHRPR